MSEVKTRQEISVSDTWDTESIYKTSADYEQDMKRVESLIAPLQALRGKLDSSSTVAEAFHLEDELGLLLDRLHLYAHMLEDQDTAVSENQARMSALRGLFAQIQGDLAWIAPEILDQAEDTLTTWRDAPEMLPYRRSMDLLIRQKPHVLSTEAETILGLAGDILDTPHQAFSMRSNADMTFEDAVDSEGKPYSVTNGSYGPLTESRDRTLRQSAFTSIHKAYAAHRNSIATLMSGTTKTHALEANLRHHGSALEAALFPDNVPATVYHALVEAVHESLPIYHEYVALRGRRLGLTDLNMWDMRVPIVPEIEIKVSWEQCREWVLDSLRPLGEEYCTAAASAFDERWFDIWENQGKKSGAYSTGAYGQKPFMLLNYHGTLNDVFTVAHELGHSMHTWMSQKNQPYRYSGYPIFLAEIASTTNEALLLHHLLVITDNPKLKASLLNHHCEATRGTLYRQTMLAEFELELHRRAEAGEPLTAEALHACYYELNAQYQGPAVQADELIGHEWLRIPHFYYNFYLYKYATGFSAAQVFAQRILEGGTSRDAYLELLRSGCSLDPLDAVQRAGVDLSNAAVVRQAFALFHESLKKLDTALAAMD
ncbi:TPA: oligoendopeptidase F [Candidatus Sumerlaeota bacterium]|nr:oligoendopeptidase F [Candidatus Sumerlaeota bacterium]